VTFDLVLAGGRVIDSETGLDAPRHVGVTGGRITAVSEDPLPDTRLTVDASERIVAPGFIDLHSHAGDVAGGRLQAFDGVTTALDLEAGAHPVGHAYRRAADEGRPINYGYSASWAAARMSVLAGIVADGRLGTVLGHIADPAWQRAATVRELAEIRGHLTADLADGALGIGIIVGYAPSADPAEYLDLARLAAMAGTPTYTHARELAKDDPATLIDGAEEIVRAAAETGAAMHYCHVNSTSRRRVDEVLALVDRVRRAGARLSTEAYPYGSGMTGIGATFLAPERLATWGLEPSSLTYLKTGERVATAERLAALRVSDPGGLVTVDFLDELDPVDRGYLVRALAFPDAVVASDAMPLTWPGGAGDPYRWPLPAEAVTHPRSAGTFARALRLMTREEGALSVAEVIRRSSYLPARLLEDCAPQMRSKGRVQVGCDADLVVFDPDRITDRATYAASSLTSNGVDQVLVNGRFVICDGELVTDALPGRPVRAEPSPHGAEPPAR